MKNLVISLVLLLAVPYGCGKDDPSESMAFGNIYTVDKFPNSYNLENGTKLDLGIAGVQSLSVQDSLLIVSTGDISGYWSFFRLPGYEFLGKYISKGRGASETLNSRRVEDQFFTEYGGIPHSIIYDYDLGNLLLMNIQETLREKQPSIRKLGTGLEKNLFNIVCIDSTTFFCRGIDKDMTRQSRFIVKDGEISVPDNLAELNKASISHGKDINTLGTYCIYNPERKLIVEAALELNLINMYSIDGPVRMTYCIGRKLDKIKNIEGIDYWKKKTRFCHLAGYRDFFAALYHDDTKENIETGKAKKQTTQFYSWDVSPMFEIVLDRRIDSFDIDFSTGTLYTLNIADDEIYRYDISHIINTL